MPVVRVTLIEGYDDATRRRLAERLTDAVLSTIAAPPDGVTVAIEEVKPSGYMRGRVARAPGKPLPAPADTVRAFLAAMQARDLDGARAWLADGFTMTFPGGARFTRLEDLVAWGRERYRSVSKSYTAVEESFGPDGIVVYCHGVLSGEWPDGAAFEGVRFIDRFRLDRGRIVDQKVWNDLGEARLAAG